MVEKSVDPQFSLRRTSEMKMESKGREVSVLRMLGIGLGLAFLLAGLSGQARAFEPVPEMDAGSIVSGLTLLTGGLLILIGCRGRKSS